MLRVIDGDTIEIEIDLGFDIKHTQQIRLIGIDTPEIRSGNDLQDRAGKLVKEYVKNMIEGETIIVETNKEGSFGRYLGNIYYDNCLINEHLLDKGYAVIYDDFFNPSGYKRIIDKLGGQ